MQNVAFKMKKQGLKRGFKRLSLHNAAFYIGEFMVLFLWCHDRTGYQLVGFFGFFLKISIMESKQPLRVVTLNYPPFSYIDSQGNYDGMEVRFLKYETPD